MVITLVFDNPESGYLYDAINEFNRINNAGDDCYYVFASLIGEGGYITEIKLDVAVDISINDIIGLADLIEPQLVNNTLAEIEIK